jgi:hypothetical protein
MPETETETARPVAPAGGGDGKAGFRLAVFAAVLLVAVATGFGIGRLTGTPGATPAPSAPAAGSGDGHAHGGGTGTGATGAHADPPGTPPHAHNADGSNAAPAGADVGGLAVSANGLRLVPATTTLAAGKPSRLAFRIEDQAGAAATRFAVVHDKPLHLIVARRDLTGFQHLHPAMAADGTWSVDVRLPEAGPWRMFADFTAVGADGTQTPAVLGADLTVPGTYAPAALPAPAVMAQAGGFRVHREGAPRRGATQPLLFHVTAADGRAAALEPYLGAFGHLVVLRAGDLGYVHVHPEPQLADGAIKFWLAAPSRGDYRMFLDFQVAGQAHTAAFTLTVS